MFKQGSSTTPPANKSEQGQRHSDISSRSWPGREGGREGAREGANCVQSSFSESLACKALGRQKAVLSAFLRLQTLACWRTVRGQLGWAIPFKLINDASQFVAPIFINLLLDVVESGKPPSVGYTLACLMFLGLMIGTLADNQHFQRTMRAGVPLYSLSGLITKPYCPALHFLQI